jgi:hypothetical protein
MGAAIIIAFISGMFLGDATADEDCTKKSIGVSTPIDLHLDKD